MFQLSYSCLLIYVPKALLYCNTDIFLPPKAPITNWGAKWPGGLTDPSCPGEEERERERERDILRVFIHVSLQHDTPYPYCLVPYSSPKL